MAKKAKPFHDGASLSLKERQPSSSIIEAAAKEFRVSYVVRNRLVA
jgi:hypothetical protein